MVLYHLPCSSASSSLLRHPADQMGAREGNASSQPTSLKHPSPSMVLCTLWILGSLNRRFTILVSASNRCLSHRSPKHLLNSGLGEPVVHALENVFVSTPRVPTKRNWKSRHTLKFFGLICPRPSWN